MPKRTPTRIAELDRTYTQHERIYAHRARIAGSTLGHGLAVRTSRLPRAGCGLFATRVFRRNEIVTGMEGRLLDHRQATQLRTQGKHRWIRTVHMLATYVDGLRGADWGGTDGAAGASFANDGRGPARNNTKFHTQYRIPGAGALPTPVVVLKATRTIAKGDEIYVSYGTGYWR